MAITKRNPRTVLLYGQDKVIEVDDADHVASAAITPGHLVELHDSGGALKVRANASATEIHAVSVALDRFLSNDDWDTAYAAGDQVRIAYLRPGCVFYGLIASGQNISRGELLSSAGDGTLQSAAATTEAAGVGRFQSLDNPGSVAVATRLRVLVIN